MDKDITCHHLQRPSRSKAEVEEAQHNPAGIVLYLVPSAIVVALLFAAYLVMAKPDWLLALLT